MAIIQNDRYILHPRILNESKTVSALDQWIREHWFITEAYSFVELPIHLPRGIFVCAPSSISSEDSPTLGVKNTITEVWPLIWLCFGPLHKKLRTWTIEFEGKKEIFRNPLIILIFYIWKKESPERSRWCAKARKSTVRVWVQYGFPYTAVCLIGNHLLKYGTIHRGALV